MFKLSARSKRHLEGVDPRLTKIICRALELTNVDFGIPISGGKRTSEQQQELFKQGLSTLNGTTRKSKHQSGLAVDVFAYVDGQTSYDYGDMAMIAAAMLQAAGEYGVQLKWGGHWKSFKDMPHYEIVETGKIVNYDFSKPV